MNYKAQFIVCLVLLLNTVYGVKMTKDEAKKTVLLTNSNYNNKNNSTDNICPEYSYQTDNKPTICHYTFYCIDDNNCQSVKDPKSSVIEFVENDGSIHKYFTNGNQCTQDSDCLNNKCTNGTCVAGKSKFTECIDRYDVIDEDVKWFCGRPNGGECSSDNHCVGECSFNTCKSSHERNSISESTKKGFTIFIYFLIALPFICIILCITACCCYTKRRDRKEMEMKLANINTEV